jgi:molybdopterin-guanine dinucleotide biosynthesis protein A
MTGETAIVVLAGGRATRFPGKLELEFDGEPLLMRVCHRVAQTGLPLYVAGSAPFLPSIVSQLNATPLEDRWPGGGPLRAMLSAFEAVDCERAYLVAGDQPNVDAQVFRLLEAAWEPGDEAVVPRHGTRIEPLAALYDRRAAIVAARTAVERGNEAMHALIEALKARFVDVSASYFANLNTPADFEHAARMNP